VQNDRRQLKRDFGPGTVLVGKTHPGVKRFAAQTFPVVVPGSVNGLCSYTDQMKQALRYFRFSADKSSVLGGKERRTVEIGSVDVVLVQ
jgi:hypothetical protein